MQEFTSFLASSSGLTSLLPCDMQPAITNPSQPPAVVFMDQPIGPVHPKVLPLKSFHFVLGIIQVIVGVLMFLLEVAAMSFGVPFTRGEGISCGILIFVAGLLSLLGARFNSRPLITACMILNIIATVACFSGLRLSIEEVHWTQYPSVKNSGNNRYPYFLFGFGKSVFILIWCLFEFILTIVHASLSCRSVCLCCMPGPKASGQPGAAYQTDPAYGSYVGQQQAFGYVGPQQPQAPAYYETAQVKS